MFVKLKKESESNTKTPHIFYIEDNATVYDLKCNILEYLEIDVEDQEIRTLVKILSDADKLADVLKQCHEFEDKLNGTAISLYSNKKFICFLQIYTNAEGYEQNNFFSQPEDTITRLPLEPRMPQYCEINLDSQESWQSSASNSNDSTSSNTSSSKSSATSSDNESDRKSVKRKESDKCGDKDGEDAEPKRICFETKKSEIVESKCTKDKEIQSKQPERISEPLIKCASPLESSELPSTEVKEPYSDILPEHRRYILVITKDVDGIKLPEYYRFMNHYFELFKAHNDCASLTFSEKEAVSLFCAKIFVACSNDDTCNWMENGIRNLSPYRCFNFIKYFDLVKCNVVIPQVGQNSDISTVLQLLEKQNNELVTSKWCIVDRKLVDKKAENQLIVSHLCENYQLKLYLDSSSHEYLQKHFYKLKYCFWTLRFVF